MNRRQLLALGVPAGLALAGLGAQRVLVPPRRSRELAPVPELTARLIDGLAPEDRAAACVPFDHPLRQYHNRGVWGGGLRVWGNGLSRELRGVLTDLLHAGLSETGRAKVTNEFFLKWPGVHLMNVLVCGDPRAGPYQVILSGPHLNLRLGGASPEGAAFGGPQVWGDQRSDGVAGLPRNLFRSQFAAGQALAAALPRSLREQALLAESPVQTQVEPRGPRGPFPGLPLAETPGSAKDRARALIDEVLGLWPAADAAFARECLEANGGLDALCFSIYEEGASEGLFPIFRLEGPAAVIHFRGWPHVHAFCHVTQDGARPLSVGEPLGDNPLALEGAGVQRLFETALAARTGADLALYPLESVAGRLRAGPIRSGDIYALESWQDDLALLELEPRALVPALAARLPRGAQTPGGVTVATTGYAARNLAAQRIGRAAVRRALPATIDRKVRDVTVAHLRRHGFPDRA